MPAFLVWRDCRHELALGFSGAIHQPLSAVEIKTVTGLHKGKSKSAGKRKRNSRLFGAVRHLDDAWLGEQAKITKESQ